MPERFGLEYTDNENKRQRPVMLHRAVFGSLERFIGILLEHSNGRLPTWLAPFQVRVLSFTDRNEKYARKMVEKLAVPGLRMDADFRSVPISTKVKDAELMKIPYIIVVGDREEKEKNLAIRIKGDSKIRKMRPEEFIKKLKKEIEERR